MKKILYLLSVLVMASCITMHVQADEVMPDEFFLNGELAYFCGEYLTEVEQNSVIERLNEIKNEYGVEVVVFMTETEFTTGDIFQDANMVYDANLYGTGIMLYVDNYRGEMQILARNEEGVSTIFTDYAFDVLVDNFVDLYGKNVYYAVSNYIDTTEAMIIQAESGVPYSEENPFESEDIELTLEDRIVDKANLLSDSEEEILLEKIDIIADEYEFDVVIYSTDDPYAFYATDEADDFYDYNGYGYGDDYDGILFYINMGTRDWAISTTGYGLEAFTDYGTDLIGARSAEELSNDNFYEAMNIYLDMTYDFLEEAESGKPYDTNNKYLTMTDIIIRIAIAIVIAMVIAGIVLLIMSRKMKTAVPQMYAKEYMKKDSFHLTNSRDLFLYSNTVRTAIPKSSSGSGGGTSSHSGSSGRSHGGSSGSF